MSTLVDMVPYMSLHLFRCTNPLMTTTVHTNTQKLQESLYKDGLTTTVATAFVNELCRCAKKPPLAKTLIDCEKTLATGEAQQTLGVKAFVRGLHHVDWAYLLQDTWVPPATLPDGKRNAVKTQWRNQSHWYEEYEMSRKPSGSAEMISSTEIRGIY